MHKSYIKLQFYAFYKTSHYKQNIFFSIMLKQYILFIDQMIDYLQQIINKKVYILLY